MTVFSGRSASAEDRGSCERCVHHSLCQVTAAPGQIDGQPIRIKRHASLIQAGDVVGPQIFSVRSGSFKIMRAAAGSEPQVIGFALPPELIALDALGDSRHACSVIALEDSEVCGITWRRLPAIGYASPLARPGLHAVLSTEIRRAQHAALMLRNTQAEQRMADLMLTLSQRHAANGYSPTQFRLPMSRCDIASYLGVTAECISRLILQFRRNALFELRRRDLTLLDLGALRKLAARQAPARI